MRPMKTAFALTLALAAGACDQATGPEEGQAEFQVLIEGSGESAAGSASRSGATFSRSVAEAQGEVEVRARVFVRSSAGSWIELTRGAAEQTVSASGTAEARVLATARVRPDTYERVRVEFEHVRAEGVAWLDLGLGPIEGAVRVELGSDGEAVVERALVVDARADATTELRIDLNAEAWMSRTDEASRTVAEADFESAVTISAR